MVLMKVFSSSSAAVQDELIDPFIDLCIDGFTLKVVLVTWFCLFTLNKSFWIN